MREPLESDKMRVEQQRPQRQATNPYKSDYGYEGNSNDRKRMRRILDQQWREEGDHELSRAHAEARIKKLEDEVQRLEGSRENSQEQRARQYPQQHRFQREKHYSFHHTYIPEEGNRYMDEDDYENFDREESYQHSSSNDKDNSQSLPAAEETAIIDQNKKTWSQTIVSLLRQVFGSQDTLNESLGSDYPLNSEVSEEPADYADLPYGSSPDDKFNIMDWSQYEHEVVLRFNWTSSRERSSFVDAAKTLVLDVWRVGKNSGDIRLPSNRLQNFLRLLPKALRKPEARVVLIPDLEHAVYNAFPAYKDAIDLEKPLALARTARSKWAAAMSMENSDVATTKVDEARAVALELLHTTSELFFQDYRDLDTVYAWLNMLHETFPHQVRGDIIGQTHEGRDIVAYHIHASESDDVSGKKKTIVLTSGIHAREWISVTSSLYLLYQLLVNQDQPAESNILNNLDFLIIPVMNPDGYVYSWEHDRLWRKNRQDTGVSICHGIDIDSSFAYHWRPSVGTPCSEGYAGQGPLEALEARHFANYINNTSADHQYFGYIDLHSYSQTILYPYGYSCEAETRDQENLLELAYGLAKSIRLATAKHYEVLPACQDREFDPDDGAGGCALDFMYKIHAIWAFQVKLRDTGNHGFLLPKKYITPVGTEMYSALRYFCDFILSPR